MPCKSISNKNKRNVKKLEHHEQAGSGVDLQRGASSHRQQHEQGSSGRRSSNLHRSTPAGSLRSRPAGSSSSRRSRRRRAQVLGGGSAGPGRWDGIAAAQPWAAGGYSGGAVLEAGGVTTGGDSGGAAPFSRGAAARQGGRRGGVGCRRRSSPLCRWRNSSPCGRHRWAAAAKVRAVAQVGRHRAVVPMAGTDGGWGDHGVRGQRRKEEEAEGPD